jgi:uncharacterized membrane protein
MPRFYLSARARLGAALAASSLASVGLFFIGAWSNHSFVFAYLMWNLFLAWIPLLLALQLERILRTKLWSSWLALLFTVLWVGFLPNSFYLITDYIHIQEVVPRVDLLYDVVMFSSFIFNGVVLGYISLYLVHWQLVQRVSARLASALVGFVLLLSSFAIYIGRELRWNTWDIIANPASLLLDVSDRVLNPREHPQAFTTTITFFVLLTSIYLVVWTVVRYAARRPANS